MGKKFLKHFSVACISSFTIEFALIFNKLSHGVTGVLATDLAMAKVCQFELGQNLTTCQDLASHKDLQAAVQTRVNRVEMTGDIMTRGPILLYSFLAGSLSDKYGRWPLLLLPSFGSLLSAVALILNRVYFEEWPVEALWSAQVYFLAGGTGLWYLGVYSIAADITTPRDRASRMARYDGIEQISQVVGNALSPILFASLGFLGTFITKLVFSSILLVLVVSLRKKTSHHQQTVNKTDPPSSLLDR